MYGLLVGVALPRDWFDAIVANAQGGFVYDFESGNLDDWLVQGQVDLVSNAIDSQTMDTLPTVAQGNFSVRIGDEMPWGVVGDRVSAIERELTIPSVDQPVLQFSYAVIANDPANHDQDDKPSFSLEIFDLTTNELLPVSDFQYSSQTSDAWLLGRAPNAADVGQTSFQWINGDRWVFIPWRHEQVDLSGRAGHRMRISFILSDCWPSAHAAYGYFDNIRIGSEAPPPPLPPLVGTPDTAGAPVDPGTLATFFTWVEQNKIWPLVACLTPLLFLFLAGMGGYGVVRVARPPNKTTASSYEEPIQSRQPTNTGARAGIKKDPPKDPDPPSTGSGGANF